MGFAKKMSEGVREVRAQGIEGEGEGNCATRISQGWKSLLDGRVRQKEHRKLPSGRRLPGYVPKRRGEVRQRWRAEHEREHRGMMRYLRKEPFACAAVKVRLRKRRDVRC